MEMDGEFMAVPVGENAGNFNGMRRMNEVSAEILDLLKNGQEDVVDEAIEYYRDLMASPKRKYNKTYYNDTRRYSRSSEYYYGKDPRKDHYKF